MLPPLLWLLPVCPHPPNAPATYRDWETLKDLELEFADQFIRIHRNALVSIKFLDGIESICSGQYQVRLRDIAERLVISRRHLPQLRESIQQL